MRHVTVPEVTRVGNLVRLVTILVTFNLASVAHGQTAKSPADFDIVSIKLHMTGHEVAESLRARFGAKVDPVNGIRVTTSPGKYNPTMSYVSQVHYQTKDFSLTVEFWEVFPASSAQREGAYRISYVANTKTQADVEDMKQSILAKYGAPTKTGPTGDLWCEAASCDPNQPLMNANPMSLDPQYYVGLTDEGFRRQMEAAFSKSKTGSRPL